MSSETYKAWLDSMPIDDVRSRIERLQQKLADLQVLERLYSDRHDGAEQGHVGSPGSPPEQRWEEASAS